MPRIVHLSDIHLNKTHLDNFRFGTFSALLEDLKEYHKNQAIDLIVISGDLVDKGGASFDNNLSHAFQVFEQEFVSKLSAGLNIEKHRILFVAGNHDLDRNADSQIVESGLKAKLNSKQNISEYLRVAIPPSGNPEGIKRIIPYNTFFKSYHSGFKGVCHVGDLHSSFKFGDGRASIGVSCINSAWRTYNSSADKGQLLVGESELITNLTLIRECDVKIAVLHHPIEFLSDIEKCDIQALISKEYDMLLCGHSHAGSNQSVVTLDNCLFTSMAPCNWSENYSENIRHLNGYSILDFNRTTNTVSVSARCYSPDRKKYVPNEHLGDKGMAEYPVTRRAISPSYDCLNYIKQYHLPELNEHLLSHGTDTKSPKTIEEIFVLPKLVYDVKYKEEKKEEKEYSLDDLCGITHDVVFFGIKESGKTLLLDCVCGELVKRYDMFGKIPILIRFNELRNEDYETLISRFLNVPIMGMDEFLQNHKVVLLVDNLSFDNTSAERLKKLSVFIKNYSNVRLFATSLVEGEGSYPGNFLANEYISAKPASIKTFKTRQIKDLIAKWFSNIPSQNNKQNLERLLEVLKGLNLPGTPLSLSMFLWIIEQQGGYRPINQATMLENFIEKILEKHSSLEIYSEQFDYRNKERLLADIAYKMNTLDNPGYKIGYPDLLTHITDYLNARKFSFDGDALLKDLISSGILVKEMDGASGVVKFRFACFFEYFVMKQIEFDEAFRVKVLGDDCFLSYANEIGYYTGIKRDRTDILKLIVGRMWSEFLPLITGINNIPKTYDGLLDTTVSLVSTFDENRFNQEIDSKRPTDAEMEANSDKVLATIEPEKDIKKKKISGSHLDRLEKLWMLAARLLKNTEECSEPGLKEEAYSKILTASMSYAVLLRISLKRKIADKKKAGEEIDEFMSAINLLLPLLHQAVLNGLMSSKKLVRVFEEKIEADLRNDAVSEFERYLSVFLYADSHGPKSQSYIKQFVVSIKNRYMFDMSLFKLLEYFFFNSATEEAERLYRNMMADIIVKSKGLKKEKKSAIIAGYDREKLVKKFRGETVEDDSGI